MKPRPRRAGRRAVVCNRRGLHARPAAQFVKLATRFESEISVTYQDMTVPGRSIMGLLMLGAARGAEIDISAAGPDAGVAVAALADFVAGGFGEE